MDRRQMGTENQNGQSGERSVMNDRGANASRSSMYNMGGQGGAYMPRREQNTRTGSMYNLNRNARTQTAEPDRLDAMRRQTFAVRQANGQTSPSLEVRRGTQNTAVAVRNPEGATPAAGTQRGNGTPRVSRVAGNGTYGNHSSYRTADGRIIDGFDSAGRPIYRDLTQASTESVVRRTAFSQTQGRRLHPVRRIRVETQIDTVRKPFPIKLILLILFCTACAMGVLYTYMELNKTTNELSELNTRLSTQRSTYNMLSSELVQREDLIAIEEMAAQTLGMVKNDVLTKKYVSIENEDRTELVAKVREEAKKRSSVEIDLDTGLPIDGSSSGGNLGYSE